MQIGLQKCGQGLDMDVHGVHRREVGVDCTLVESITLPINEPFEAF